MQYIRPDVSTICTGMAASMGAVLLCGGAAGKRTGLKHSRVMIHQPLGGARGQASDIEITAREIQKLKKELYNIIATHSGQTYDKVWEDSDRDYWMIAEEAKGANGKVDMVADGVSGRVRKHLATSTQEVTTHMDGRIDALEKKMGAMDSKLDAISAKLL